MNKWKLMGKRLPWVLTLASMGVALGAGFWVYWQPQTAEKNTPPGQRPGSSLSNITLTEFDNNGTLIWEIKAGKAEYSEDNSIAQILTVSGQFYRQGKVLIQATGKAGSVNQKDREITLQGNVQAKMLTENIQITADRMIWRADEDLLTATGNIRIVQPDRKIVLIGKALRANPSSNRFTLDQEVVVTSMEPPLVLKTPSLTWEATQAKIRIDVPFEVFHTTEDLMINAQKGLWDIGSQRITLDQEVVATAPRRGWQLISSQLDWQIPLHKLNFPQPLLIKSASLGYEVRSQRGMVDLIPQVVHLIEKVQATSTQDRSVLTADQATWTIPSQQVNALGNVVYRQSRSDLDVKGDRAVANLQNQTVVVTSASPTAVETWVVPE